MSSKEIDHRYTDTAICPYCGDDNGKDDMDRSGTTQCGSCEKNFGYEPSYSVSYTTWKIPCLNGEPHNYREPYDPGPSFDFLMEECRDCERRNRVPKSLEPKP